MARNADARRAEVSDGDGDDGGDGAADLMKFGIREMSVKATINRFQALKQSAALATTGAALALSGAAVAQPVPGGIGLQPANSALAEDVHFFHNVVLMPIITAISLFVLGLLIWVVVRYNRKSNPVPRKFSHNTLVEVVWTVAPILILLVIALPSFELLYDEDVTPDGKQAVYEGDGRTRNFLIANDFSDRRMATRSDHVEVYRQAAEGLEKLRRRADYRLEGLGEGEIRVAFEAPPAPGETIVVRAGRSKVGRGDRAQIALAPSMTLKVVGYQWGWTYSYPDFGDFEFSANMLPESATTPELYRFATDNPIVVPVGETIRVTTTARDVIHSWAMPNFAIKIDAVPGRINETWFNADRTGVFYGQCSEICGIKHAFMPIEVRVVTRPEFEAWVNEQREGFGMEPMSFDDENEVVAATDAPAADEG